MVTHSTHYSASIPAVNNADSKEKDSDANYYSSTFLGTFTINHDSESSSCSIGLANIIVNVIPVGLVPFAFKRGKQNNIMVPRT
jgi:hypothetical protein